ncbi:hypothetical protein MKX03_004253, partial [Papaver bracteatum]
MMSNPVVEDFIDKAIILEPTPISTLPPKPLLTDEDFEREVSLMMVDTMDSMDAEPSSAHDLV